MNLFNAKKTPTNLLNPSAPSLVPSKQAIPAFATSTMSKGRIWIKVVEARNLITTSSRSKPYCVVEFEKIDFVTREAISCSFSELKDKAAISPSTLMGAKENLKSRDKVGLMTISENGLLDEQVHLHQEEWSEAHLQRMGFNPVWKHEASFDVTRPDGEITISIWDRHHGAVLDEGEYFLGMMKIRPPRVEGRLHDNWFRLQPLRWKENVRGDLRIQLMYQNISSKALGPTDFDLLKVVGKGSFGKVLQVKKKDTGRIYAMKILTKKDIVARKEIQHTLSERNVLIMATSPFLVGLKFSFQTPEKLYFVLDYMNGGELFYHLQRETAFSEYRARFYTAELILALQHLHKHNIIYRDLKPENILLDSNGHIAITDFGLCKENINGNDMTATTFCGTAEYLAPEVLLQQGYGKAVDWWSLGILFYEMCSGLPPFYSENTNVMYRKILYSELKFSPTFSPLAQSLCAQLLERDPLKRLGTGPSDAQEIICHPFFTGVDWDLLSKKQITPPFKPRVESEADTSNFDPIFTKAMPMESLAHSSMPLSETLQQNFKGFTYSEEEGLTASLSTMKLNR